MATLYGTTLKQRQEHRTLNRLACYLHSILWEAFPGHYQLWVDMTDEDRDQWRLRVLACVKGEFGRTMLLHEPDSEPGRMDGDLHLPTDGD